MAGAIQALLTEAVAQHRAGQMAAAEPLYRAVLAEQADNLNALKLLGVLLAQTGRPQQAEPLLSQVAQRLPGDADTLANWGGVLVDLGRCAEAVAVLTQSLRLAPAMVPALTNLARAYLAQDEAGKAEQAARQALGLVPTHGPALTVLAEGLLRRSQAAEAAGCCRAALAAGYDRPGLWANYLAALVRSQQAAEAIRQAGLARQRWPNHPAILAAEAVALDAVGQVDAAVARVRQALAGNDQLAEAWATLSGLLYSQGGYVDGVQAAQRALALRADYPAAQMNLALCLLAQGEWADGFAAYEARLAHISPPLPQPPCPRWQGQITPGLHLLVLCEQGLGDTLQFCRYAVQAQQLGLRVTLAVQPRLRTLLQQQWPGLAVVENAAAVAAEAWAPLLSLPLLLAQPQPRPIAPYLQAQVDLVRHWSDRLRVPGRLMVGLNWQGNAAMRVDRGRSLPLTTLAPLADVPGIAFLALQQGAGSEQRADWPGSLPSPGPETDATGAFVDTAAILAGAVDVLITSDTAIAHLAGALGVPCWLLLQAAPDWRWGAQGGETPWYASLRLYRQSQAGAWGPVVAKVAEDLRRLAAQTLGE